MRVVRCESQGRLRGGWLSPSLAAGKVCLMVTAAAAAAAATAADASSKSSPVGSVSRSFDDHAVEGTS